MLQTVCFWNHAETADGRHHFIDPTPYALLSEFPKEFNLTLLSVGFNLSRGPVSCTHVIEIDGAEVFRQQHPDVIISCNGGGTAFSLELLPMKVGGPCILTIKASLSDGTVGADLTYPILDKFAAFPQLNVKP